MYPRKPYAYLLLLILLLSACTGSEQQAGETGSVPSAAPRPLDTTIEILPPSPADSFLTALDHTAQPDTAFIFDNKTPLQIRLGDEQLLLPRHAFLDAVSGKPAEKVRVELYRDSLTGNIALAASSGNRRVIPSPEAQPAVQGSKRVIRPRIAYVPPKRLWVRPDTVTITVGRRIINPVGIRPNSTPPRATKFFNKLRISTMKPGTRIRGLYQHVLHLDTIRNTEEIYLEMNYQGYTVFGFNTGQNKKTFDGSLTVIDSTFRDASNYLTLLAFRPLLVWPVQKRIVLGSVETLRKYKFEIDPGWISGSEPVFLICGATDNEGRLYFSGYALKQAPEPGFVRMQPASKESILRYIANLNR